MASIYTKTEKGPLYAQWTDNDGKRHQKSTRTTNPVEAQEMADQWEKESKSSVSDETTQKALAILRSATALGSTLTAERASQFLKDIQRIYNPDLGKTFHEYADAWLERKKPNIKERSFTVYQSLHDRMKKNVDDLPLESLTKDHFYSLRKNLLEKHKSSTVNQVIAHAASILKQAVKDDLIPKNPADIDKLATEDSIERGCFTPEEVQKIISTADTETGRLIRVAASTGLRMMDVATLSSDNIQGGYFSVSVQKTKKGSSKIVRIPISEGCIWVRGRQGPLFPNLARTSESALSQKFTRLMKRAGVPREVNKHGVKQTRSFHSLRHTFATQLQEAGVPKDVRQSLTGHISGAVHDGYNHPDECLKEAISKLPQY